MNNEIEMRALETQDDYQREYDSLFKQLSRTNLLIIKFKDQQIEAVNAAKKTWDKKIDSAYEEFYEIEDDIKKLLTDAKSKGFNIKKRSEETEDIKFSIRYEFNI